MENEISARNLPLFIRSVRRERERIEVRVREHGGGCGGWGREIEKNENKIQRSRVL